MELKTGKINNTERKFIPIRKSSLNKYIENLKFVECYKITQYYSQNYKYRKFESDNIKYTRSKEENSYTNIKEIEEDEFINKLNNNKIIVKVRKKYKDDSYTVEIDEFFKPCKMTMIEVSSNHENLKEYKASQNFIEVTGSKAYKNRNIANGSIKKSDIIIEGTDGVGKTTTIVKLLSDGIVCQDRCEDVISKNMLFNIKMTDRAEAIYERYFDKEQDTIVIFLINLNKEELERRIKSRGEISKFDLEAYEYGLLYKETYEYLIENYNTKGRLIMIDCTNLNIEEQYEKVKNAILKGRQGV